jgi:hypothetical protein
MTTPTARGYVVVAVDGTEDPAPGVRRTTPPLVVVLLAVASLASAGCTLLAPDLLAGPAAMNGSAKGTALVVAAGGVPVLVVAYRRAVTGSVQALALAAGAAAYLVYNAVLLVFATPFNQAFPLYEAMLGLGIWTLVGTSSELWRRGQHLGRPAGRWVPAYILAVVTLNALAWAGSLMPALLSDHPRSMLDGTGLTTNPVYVQDLAFWLPAIAWVSVGMWRAHGPRTALGATVLCYWVLESVGVAVDQWWGHHADPTSTVASAGAVPLFVVVALLTLWPLTSALRTLSGTVGPPAPDSRLAPPRDAVGGRDATRA